MTVYASSRQYFYRMTFSYDDDNTWLLDELSDLSGRQALSIGAFNSGSVGKSGLSVKTCSAGRHTDVHFGSREIIYVRPVIGEAISAIAGDDVERLRILVDGEPGVYEVLNVRSVIDCIAHERVVADRFAEDFANRHAAGKYKSVPNLIVRRAALGAHHVVRPSDFETAVLVSEAIKSALDELSATGIQFLPIALV